jgi:hypothetical protein
MDAGGRGDDGPDNITYVESRTLQLRLSSAPMSQVPLGHLRYAMTHKITIVPIGTNEKSDHHGDRPMRRKIRHDGIIVRATSTT